MRKSLQLLFLSCFLLFTLTIPLTAKEVEKLVIKQDTVISEDTTWRGDVTVNEGVTLTIKDCTLTTEEGWIRNKGSLVMENANLTQKGKTHREVDNYGTMEVRDSSINSYIYLKKDSILLAKNSKLEGVCFHGDNAKVTFTHCEINRLFPEYDISITAKGKNKINILITQIHVLENANVSYIENKFTKESGGYVIPKFNASTDTKIDIYGYGMQIGNSAKVTIKKSQLSGLDLKRDSQVTVEDCKFLYFGNVLNWGGVLKVKNSSFNCVWTNDPSAVNILTDCFVKRFVKNTKGKIYLINTHVADTLYADKILKEGESLP